MTTLEEFEKHKSEYMEDMCREHEWETAVDVNMDEFRLSGNVGDIMWTLYARRGKETLKVEWRGDVQIKATYKDRKGKITNPAWRGGVVRIIEAKSHINVVPFNIEDDSAYDIMLALMQKKITFVRKVDGEEDEIFVDVNLKDALSRKHFKLKETSTGRRVLEWVDIHGFHAVGLDQIIGVE